MNRRLRQSGLTLTEMVVVVGVMALLGVVGLPGVRSLMRSFETESGALAMIDAALASARAMAIREQRYVGVRFQKAYNSHRPDDVLSWDQYMVLIVNDPEATDLMWGFRALPGAKPIRLPESIGVMDLTIVTNWAERPYSPADSNEQRVDDPTLTNADRDLWLADPIRVMDTTTFSIVFSPTGKVVIHGVRVRNRNGYVDSDSPSAPTSSDDVFNKVAQVQAGIGMFYQDDAFESTEFTNPYGNLGLGPEASRQGFLVYDRDEFRRAFERRPSRAWSDYLDRIVDEQGYGGQDERVYINRYTGRMVRRD